MNSWLLGALLAMLVIEPFLSQAMPARWAFDILLSATFVAGVWSVSRERRLLVLGLLLAGPALVGKWGGYLLASPALGTISLLFVLAFLVFTAVVVLTHVLSSTTVTHDTLAGAMCVYLLLGVIWAMMFALIESVQPGSFLVGGESVADAHGGQEGEMAQFLYLSFVTLTTVGYGDILPTTPVARRVAVLEAVVGQLYVAVLIARLVSQRVSARPPASR